MTHLSTLVGQQEATQRLRNLFARERVPHALLLEGPASVGKFTAARAIAQALLCKQRPPGTADACDQCPACIKFENSSHADFHIVNPEGRIIKIDMIRDAEKLVRLRAQEGGAKVLIIRDAHRMNPAAQNALLKTLEEPPDGTHLILTTSRLRIVLPTVVSRCQRVPFATVPHAVVVRSLIEKRSMDPIAANLVAGLAQGSLGRALAMELEPVLSARERAITWDRATDDRAILGGLKNAEDAAEEKEALLEVLDMMQVWLHDQLALAAGEGTIANADREAELAHLAESRGLYGILSRLEKVMEARRQLELPYNFNPLLVAEHLTLALSGLTTFPRINRN